MVKLADGRDTGEVLADIIEDLTNDRSPFSAAALTLQNDRGRQSYLATGPHDGTVDWGRWKGGELEPGYYLADEVVANGDIKTIGSIIESRKRFYNYRWIQDNRLRWCVCILSHLATQSSGPCPFSPEFEWNSTRGD